MRSGGGALAQMRDPTCHLIGLPRGAGSKHEAHASRDTTSAVLLCFLRCKSSSACFSHHHSAVRRNCGASKHALPSVPAPASAAARPHCSFPGRAPR